MKTITFALCVFFLLGGCDSKRDTDVQQGSQQGKDIPVTQYKPNIKPIGSAKIETWDGTTKNQKD